MANRENNFDSDKPRSTNCIVQVIVPHSSSDVGILNISLNLNFLLHKIMLPAVNFMPDRPEHLTKFTDKLRELADQSKTD